MTVFSKEISSIVGKLTLVANEKALIAILWENEKPHRLLAENPIQDENHPILKETEKELREYFNGHRRTFNIPLDLIGTDFQKQVWDVLKTIPYGTTLSYAQVANRIGNPKAVRAVGGAIGKNPISIIIPCHRVIGANGTLTGFAGGIQTKEKLLQLEKQA